jgi:hypothetical protein
MTGIFILYASCNHNVSLGNCIVIDCLAKESLQNPVVQDRGMIKSRHETDYLRR